MSDPIDRKRAASDLIGLGAMSFCAGVFGIQATQFFARGHLLAWFCVFAAITSLLAAVTVGRRIFLRVT